MGNPYSSAIDAKEFIKDNIPLFNPDGSPSSANTGTTESIEGTLYFWIHFATNYTHILRDYQGGYALYNLSGALGPATPPLVTTDGFLISTLGSSSLIPRDYIPVGQGFFVNADEFINGDVTFKNSQRVFVREGYTGINDGSLFFKSSDKTKKQQPIAKKDIRSKIRLQFISSTGFKRQLLIGADKNATDDFNFGYDAPMVDTNKDDMYWMLNDSKFVIQGVSSFNISKEFPLGIKVSKAGIASIKIDTIENLNENIYILDQETDETYLINDTAFDIYLEQGTYDNRFKIVFQPKAEVISENEDLAGVSTYYNSETSMMRITSKMSDEMILNVGIYDLQGQEIEYAEVNAKEVSIPVAFELAIYILHIQTESGVISKKVVFE